MYLQERWRDDFTHVIPKRISGVTFGVVIRPSLYYKLDMIGIIPAFAHGIRSADCMNRIPLGVVTWVTRGGVSVRENPWG